MVTLTKPHLEDARNAIVSGFFTWSQIDQLAAVALDVSIEAEVGRGALKDVVWELLKLTEANGQTGILLREAIARKPGNPKLAQFARQLGLAPAPFHNVSPAGQLLPAVGAHGSRAAEGFEAIVLRNAGMAKPGEWRKLMTRREQAVCQVLFSGDAIGTGFLVGPDLILSNWHVFEHPYQGGKLGPLDRFTARFDYRAADEANVVSLGTVVPLDAAAGYLDQSPKTELDYVIVKLVEKIVEEQPPGGHIRDWLTLGSAKFQSNEPTLVLQHPKGRTLELAIGPITGWVQDRAGEVYEHLANTEEGSSGSPCFSCGWELLALHHRVDPITGKCNRAIATTAILSRMGAIGTIGLLPAV
jgi:V8-like Glu-specific endopeptidase